MTYQKACQKTAFSVLEAVRLFRFIAFGVEAVSWEDGEGKSLDCGPRLDDPGLTEAPFEAACVANRHLSAFLF